MSPKPTEAVAPTGRGILLDEMLSQSIAEQLRSRGLDAIALTGVPELSGIPDEEVLSNATSVNRIVVTPNVRDFVVLDRQWRDAGRPHSGIACLDSQAFRQDRAFIGNVVTALAKAADKDSLPLPGFCTFISQ